MFNRINGLNKILLQGQVRNDKPGQNEEAGIADKKDDFVSNATNNSKKINALIKQLSSNGTPIDKLNAFAQLFEMSSELTEAIPDLIRIARDNEDFYARRAALNLLAKIGTDNEQALSTLALAIDDKNPFIREDAARTITNLPFNIQKSNKDVIRSLLKIISNNDAPIYARKKAASVLGNIGIENQEVSSVLIKMLDDKNAKTYAAIALAKATEGNKINDIKPQIAKVLLEAIKSGDSISIDAGEALGNITPVSKEVIQELGKLLEDKNVNVKKATLIALSNMNGRANDGAVEYRWELIKILKGDNDELKTYAAIALVKSRAYIHIDDDSKKLLSPILIKGLESGDIKVRIKSAEALGEAYLFDFEKEEKALTKALQDDSVKLYAAISLAKTRGFKKENKDNLREIIVNALSNPDSTIRASAVEALKNLFSGDKEEDRKLAYRLSDSLNDPSEKVRKSAIIALSEGPSSIRKLLVRNIVDLLLKDNSNLVKEAAAKALGRIEGDPKILVPALVEALKVNDPKVKAAAAKSLGEIKENANLSIPALIEALKDENIEVKKAAIIALGDIGEKAKGATTVLIEMLKTDKADLKSDIVTTLGKIKADSDELIPLLVEILNNKDDSYSSSSLKYYSVDTLGELGEINKNKKAVTKILLQVLENDKGYKAINSAKYLLKINPDSTEIKSKVVNKLIQLFKAEKDSYAKPDIMKLIGSSGYLDNATVEFLLNNPRDFNYRITDIKPDTEEIVTTLIKALDSPNKETKKIALQMLGNSKIGLDKVIPTIIKSLSDEDKEVKKAAINSLTSLGSGYEAAIPDLVKLIEDPNFRDEAAFALKKLGPAAKDAIPKLVNIISTGKGSYEYRIRIAQEALDDITSNSKDGVKLLLKLLNSPEKAVREVAIRSLKESKTDISTIVPDLIEALNTPYEESKTTAIILLGKTGSKEAIAPLIRAFNTGNQTIKASALSALAELKSSDKEVISLLIQVLDNPNDDIKAFAAATLGRIGPDAKEAVPALIKALNTKDLFLRITVVESLGLIKDNSNETVQTLIKTLTNDSQEVVRARAARSLGLLDNNSPELVKILVKSLNEDNDTEVRTRVAEALGKINNNSKEVIAALLTALKNTEAGEPEKVAIIAALKKLNMKPSTESISTLFPILNVREGNSALNASELIKSFGINSAPFLIEMILEKNDPRSAVSFLTEMGPQALPYLLEILKDKPDPKNIANLFSNIDPESLAKLIESQSSRLRDKGNNSKANIYVVIRRIAENLKDEKIHNELAKVVGELLVNDKNESASTKIESIILLSKLKYANKETVINYLKQALAQKQKAIVTEEINKALKELE